MTLPKFSENDLASARDRFYPQWWIHQVSESRTVITDMPVYRLTCQDESERDLALASKPHFLKAEVTIPD